MLLTQKFLRSNGDSKGSFGDLVNPVKLVNECTGLNIYSNIFEVMESDQRNCDYQP